MTNINKEKNKFIRFIKIILFLWILLLEAVAACILYDPLALLHFTIERTSTQSGRRRVHSFSLFFLKKRLTAKTGDWVCKFSFPHPPHVEAPDSFKQESCFRVNWTHPFRAVEKGKYMWQLALLVNIFSSLPLKRTKTPSEPPSLLKRYAQTPHHFWFLYLSFGFWNSSGGSSLFSICFCLPFLDFCKPRLGVWNSEKSSYL